MTRNTKSKKNKNIAAEIENKNQEIKEQEIKIQETKIQETKRRGRPKMKTEDDRQINIRVPLSILEQWEIIKPAYGGNLTRYINKLIIDDLKKNNEKYAKIIGMLEK